MQPQSAPGIPASSPIPTGSCLALAMDLEAVLYTDDFAIQNVAIALGVRTHPINQRKARRVFWKYRCSGCGKYFDHDGECPVCGAAIKRKLK